MSIYLYSFLGSILAAGAIALRHAWKHAPEGREDEAGFSVTVAHVAPIASFHPQHSDSNRAA
jgi:hypothetical protein